MKAITRFMGKSVLMLLGLTFIAVIPIGAEVLLGTKIVGPSAAARFTYGFLVLLAGGANVWLLLGIWDWPNRAVETAEDRMKEFSFSNRVAWELFLESNQDDYGFHVMSCASRWANLVESKMSQGAKLEDIADDSSREVELSGVERWAAVSILAHCWIHGDQLRCWYNLKMQIGDEGEKANERGEVLYPETLLLR